MRHIIFLSLMLIGLLANCAPVPTQPEPMPPPPPEAAPRQSPAAEAPPPQPQAYTHEVRWPGETLSHIARWYTSSESNWEKIAVANPGLKPRRIRIGDKILIPEDLLKVRKPMPRNFVRSLDAPKRPPSARSVQPSKGPGKEELFGPAELLSPPGAAEKTELYGPIDLDQAPAHPQPSSIGR
jgi:hypothetical protein